MSAETYAVALDAGTTSVRAIAFDASGSAVFEAHRKFAQFHPHPGWVEQDPSEMFVAQLAAFQEVAAEIDAAGGSIACIGIANQRETTIIWDAETGKPVYNAIVWQCNRTAGHIDKLDDAGVHPLIHEKTGLVPDSYFSATKVAWILDHVEGVRERAQAGELLFGTVDTWIVWNLTGGAVHATDPTNASRTMFFNIDDMDWDDELLELFDIPRSMLPEVRPSSGDFGTVELEGPGRGAPISGIAGDQQAALFGQCCFKPGEAKATYGTGCFVLMNIGADAHLSKRGLLTTVAATSDGSPCYALEGSAFVCGSLLNWMKRLGLIDSPAATSDAAASIEDAGGVHIVPAFAGLGAPYWDQSARGAILGLTDATTRDQLARAALEGLAFQVCDIVEVMMQESSLDLTSMLVDGKVSLNDFLMQFQADMADARIVRPSSPEATALGAAFLAGLAVGYWQDLDELQALQGVSRAFEPSIDAELREELIEGWRDAVARVSERSFASLME